MTRMPIDYRNYNPLWPFLRELISHRDQNQCRRCKAPHGLTVYRMQNGGWKLAQGRPRPADAVKTFLNVCAVAHLDWDRTNDDPTNLALLCGRCHLRHDRPQHMYKRNRRRVRRARQLELLKPTPPRPESIA